MGIHPERGAAVRMSKPCGHADDIRAVRDGKTGRRVAQLVRMEMLDSVLLAELPKILCGRVRVHRFRAVVLREHPAHRHGLRPAHCPKQLHYIRRNVHDPQADGVLVDPRWVEEQELNLPDEWHPAEQLKRYLQALFEDDEYVAYTVAKYYEAKYNNTEEYQLLMKYSHSVETGWLSPLAGFDLYMDTHNRIQAELVGKCAADGTVITGYRIHFPERLFGTLVDPQKLKNDLRVDRRSGVDFGLVEDAIMNPVLPPQKVIDKLGRTSIIFRGKHAQVTMNGNGELIQCEPKERS